LWIVFEGNGDAFSFCYQSGVVKELGLKLEVGRKEKDGPMIEAALSFIVSYSYYASAILFSA